MGVMLRGEHAAAASTAARTEGAHDVCPRAKARAHGRSSERGAALIIAISIMTILLAIGITFFGVTRLEVKTATNVSNKVSVDLISKGVFEIAKHHLNQDFFRNPNVTTPDHSWRSLYSGAAFAGKTWAMRGGAQLASKNVTPSIDINLLNRLVGSPVYVQFPDGYKEVLFQGSRTNPWLFIPRQQGNTILIFDPSVRLVDNGDNVILTFDIASDEAVGPLRGTVQAAGLDIDYFNIDDPTFPPDRLKYPFVLPAVYDDAQGQWPVEKVNTWADVDNDGDGMRDSIWIPIPRDLFYPDDLVDNDLDGMVDETQDDGNNNDGGNEAVNAVDLADYDERIEAGVFVYHALGSFVDTGNGFERVGDGLDNDGDGFVDFNDAPGTGAPQPWEYDPTDDTVGYFLTAPLPGLVIPLDLNADGAINEADYVPANSSDNAPYVPATVRLPQTITVPVAGGLVSLTQANVDTIDNDYDLVVNEFYTYAYIGPNRSAVAPLSFQGINPVTRQIIADTTPNMNLTNPALYYEDQWRLPENWLADDADRYSVARDAAYNDINLEAILGAGNLTFEPAYWWGVLDPTDRGILQTAVRITHSGEPMCELVGRAAIYMTDEASKVNLNVAGGYTYNDRFDTAWDPTALGYDALYTANPGSVVGSPAAPIVRALNRGVGPMEFETRILPDFGAAQQAPKLWTYRAGAPQGIIDPLDPIQQFDALFPGYGRVDDNGNSVLLAMNGVDDDGDGLIDEGLFLPAINAVVRQGVDDVLAGAAIGSLDPGIQNAVANYLAYYVRLGNLEGIDEPQEYRTFAAIRNEVVANDGVDNDNDGTIDEFDELGDSVFRILDAVQNVNQIGGGTADLLSKLATVYSSDKNADIVQTDRGLRAINNLDYNHASAQQIAANLLITGNFPRTTALAHPTLPNQSLVGLVPADNPFDPTESPKGNTNGWAEGLRQGDVDVTAPYGTDGTGSAFTGGLMRIADGGTGPEVPTTFGRVLGGPQYGSAVLQWQAGEGLREHAFPRDQQIEALQTAVDIVDNRDPDVARTTLTTERRSLVDGSPLTDDITVGAVTPQVTVENPRERIEDAALMALERVDTYLEDVLSAGNKALQSVDTWWAGLVQNSAVTAATGAPAREERHISYTVTGNDAIKINEIMVRPTRRVEAETVSQPGNLSPTDIFAGAPIDLAQLDPTPFARFASDTPILPEFLVSRRSSHSIVSSPPNFIVVNTASPPEYGPGPAGVALGEGSGVFVPPTDPSDPFDPSLPNLWIQTDDGVPPNPSPPYSVGNIAQFAFFPTTDTLEGQIGGLPPGRYYLKVRFGDNTFESDFRNIKYTIKYVRSSSPPALDDNDVIDDIVTIATAPTTTEGSLAAELDDYFGYPANFDTGATALDAFWRPIIQSHYSDFVGEPAGWAFLNGTVGSPNNTALADAGQEQYYWTDGGGVQGASELGFGLEPTHTVAIVPGYALVVAFKADRDVAPALPLEIDAFEFSQEPDHEYLELVNTSNDTVDVSNWKMEVGIPDKPGLAVDPFKSTWRIPEGTQVAPQGKLLLVANKWDGYNRSVVDDDIGAPENVTANRINTNGIGMARAFPGDLTYNPGGIDFSLVTVPPIYDLSPQFDPPLTAATVVEGGIWDASGSVFDRIGDLRDYIDNNGDGASSMDDDPTSVIGGTPLFDTDNAEVEQAVTSSVDRLFLGLGGDKAYDRIVEMVNERLYRDPGAPYTFGAPSVSLETITGVDDVARLVLRGGIFPNEPERDRIDNDGDGGYLDLTQDPPLYIPGTLDKDYVDNDLNGLVDERGHGTLLSFGTPVAANPEASEGVDEGRLTSVPGRLYAGDYAAGRIPLLFLTDAAEYPSDVAYQEALRVSFEGTGSLPPGLNANTPLVNNLVQNFDFDATTNWTLDGDPGNSVQIFPGLSQLQIAHNAGAPTKLAWQDLPGLIDGQTYVVVVDAPNYTGGGAGFRIELGETGIGPFDNFSGNLLQNPVPGDPIILTLTARTDLSSELIIRGQAAISTLEINSISVYPALASYDDGSFVGIDPATGISWTQVGIDPLTGLSDGAAYVGSDDDPPHWKAFVERRWNPGDNVIVSLYNETGAVVDRVTYREYDVINRTLDDVVPTPYAAGPVNAAFASMWQPDHMGLDFYRALERKHPLYNGDRFGTSNRWEATDGNYDDWAESMSPFRGIIESGVFPHGALPDPEVPSLVALGGATLNDPLELARFGGIPNGFKVKFVDRLTRHAYWGSPLRKNLTARISENTYDLAKAITNPITAPFEEGLFGQFNQTDGLLRAPRSGAPATGMTLAGWQHRRTGVANADLTGQGALMNVPHYINEAVLVNTAIMPDKRHLVDWNAVNFEYVFDASGLGGVPFLTQADYALASAVLAKGDTRNSLAVEAPVITQAVNSMASGDSITLTVGQADFTPIRPYPVDLGTAATGVCAVCPPNQTVEEQYRWTGTSYSAAEADPPLAWSPVFLFESADVVGGTDLEPPATYPAFADGSQANLIPIISNGLAPEFRPFLFQWDSPFLFDAGGGGATFSGNIPLPVFQDGPPNVESRHALSNRAIMYVARQRDINATNPDDFRAEAVWSWDASDGLENGDYILHIGTYIPRLAERMQAAQQAAVQTTGETLLTPFAVQSFLPFDDSYTGPLTVQGNYDTQLAVDVITDRVKARGLAPSVNVPSTPSTTLQGDSPAVDPNAFFPGLTNPRDWEPAQNYAAGEDGYIAYGSNTVGDWQPVIVRVRDNFLAIRLRNMGNINEVAAFSHIVLTPKPRTAGRVNVNSANYALIDNTSRGGVELWNALLGVPGIVDVGQRSSAVNGTLIEADDNPNPLIAPGQIGARPYPPLTAFQDTDPGSERSPNAATLNPALPSAWLPTDGWTADSFARDVNFAVARTQLVNMIMQGRPEQPDGRYYTDLVQLMEDSSSFANPDTGSTIFPLSNNVNEVERYDEVVERFSRMVNSLTTRSDIFEIIATVEAGYAYDENGDGRYDYRTNREFIPTAETKARMVYERRTPTDRSDEVTVD